MSSTINRAEDHNLPPAKLESLLAQPPSPTPTTCGWTQRQQFIQSELDTFFSPEEPSSDLRQSILRGLALEGIEGRDRRFVTWRNWFSIEHSVVDEHRTASTIPWGLAELARFDSLILQRFSNLLAPQEKEAFVEFAIKHLSWVGYNGFKTAQHVETTRHAVQLLRCTLPEVLGHCDRAPSLIGRLTLVLSFVLDPSAMEGSHALLPAVYSVLGELLKAPLPWHELPLFDSMSSLHAHITWQLAEMTDPSERILLSDCINEGISASAVDSYLGGEEFDSELDYIDSEPIEEEPASSEPFKNEGPSFENLSNLKDALARALVQTSPPQGGMFWSEFLMDTSLSDPTWLLGIQGLEKTNPPEYEGFVHKLLLAASQSPFGARHLIALAIMSDNRSWRPRQKFLSTLTQASEHLSVESKEALVEQIQNVAWHYGSLVSEVLPGISPQTLPRIVAVLQRVFDKGKTDQKIS
jgi:hypothetical protein